MLHCVFFQILRISVVSAGIVVDLGCGWYRLGRGSVRLVILGLQRVMENRLRGSQWWRVAGNSDAALLTFPDSAASRHFGRASSAASLREGLDWADIGLLGAYSVVACGGRPSVQILMAEGSGRQ